LCNLPIKKEIKVHEIGIQAQAIHCMERNLLKDTKQFFEE